MLAVKEASGQFLIAADHYRIRALSLMYIFGALVDNLLTYFYVKLWGIYLEANPIVMLYWINMPLWTWLMRELAGLLIALSASIAYRKFADYLISKSYPSRILTLLRRAWLWPFYLAATLRCLPAIHNVLLILFNVETPLTELLFKILNPDF